MKTYTHAWLALMAAKRLEEIRPSLPKSTQEADQELLDFLKNHRDGVVQRA